MYCIHNKCNFERCTVLSTCSCSVRIRHLSNDLHIMSVTTSLLPTPLPPSSPVQSTRQPCSKHSLLLRRLISLAPSPVSWTPLISSSPLCHEDLHEKMTSLPLSRSSTGGVRGGRRVGGEGKRKGIGGEGKRRGEEERGRGEGRRRGEEERERGGGQGE